MNLVRGHVGVIDLRPWLTNEGMHKIVRFVPAFPHHQNLIGTLFVCSLVCFLNMCQRSNVSRRPSIMNKSIKRICYPPGGFLFQTCPGKFWATSPDLVRPGKFWANPSTRGLTWSISPHTMRQHYISWEETQSACSSSALRVFQGNMILFPVAYFT